jgi:hypothetical protein
MAPPVPPYQLCFRAVVKEQLQELARRASAAGRRTSYLEVLNQAIEQLSTSPLEWGDPRHNTRHEGGVVCYALRPPLLFSYVIYENERLVWLLDIKPAPGSPLDAAQE